MAELKSMDEIFEERQKEREAQQSSPAPPRATPPQPRMNPVAATNKIIDITDLLLKAQEHTSSEVVQTRHSIQVMANDIGDKISSMSVATTEAVGQVVQAGSTDLGEVQDPCGRRVPGSPASAAQGTRHAGQEGTGAVLR